MLFRLQPLPGQPGAVLGTLTDHYRLTDNVMWTDGNEKLTYDGQLDIIEAIHANQPVEAERLAREHILIMINDADYPFRYNTNSPEEYEKIYEALRAETRRKLPMTRIVLMTPSKPDQPR